MQALHAAGMIHCDLKPSNVLVTAQARAVLLGFGLVTYAQTECLEPTEAEVYGTPAYMAPEQAAGRPPSRASDTYALGVTLYQALTGRLPFAGKPE
jgi:eukaryotic-like serine/threonine-protein kinase